jgi:hypothetical protein
MAMRLKAGFGWGVCAMLPLAMAAACKSPAKPAEAVVSKPVVPSAPQNVDVMVPFVGCASDGQLGPEAAPTGAPRKFTLPQELVGQVSFYEGQMGGGVLGPKGWNCFLQIGSDGVVLYVSPSPIGSSQLFSDDKSWKGFTGPAIELADMSGQTSGRFEVAKVIARLFPQRMAFVRGVLAEGMGYSKKDFPTGKYPTDQYTDKTPDMVEFATPANTKGFGTDSWLLPNDQPIQGMALISGEDVDSLVLTMRLPQGQQALVPLILKQVETDATSQSPNN